MKKEMKTALLTPFDTGNIGTVTQAYATQMLIKELGISNELIYYHYDAIQNPLLLSNLRKRGLRRYIGSIAGKLMRYPAKKALWKFINSNLTLTKKTDKDHLSGIVDQYDLIIVGSDCVWNGDAFELETAYLLDFVDDNTKKGNFASSFACDDIPETLKPIYQKYLAQFPALSVREKRGAELIQELICREAEIVLDPTLTCDEKFWSKTIQTSYINVDCDYIFVAEYASSHPLIEDAVKLSKKYNLPIYCLYPPKGGLIFGVKIFLRAGPEDVLKLIKHAEYVLTDSYHMMIFSINFHKQFFAYRTFTNMPAISKYNSILSTLGLEDRLFETENLRSNQIDVLGFEEIDYNKIDKLLSNERQKSKNYLRKLLKIDQDTTEAASTSEESLTHGGGYRLTVYISSIYPLFAIMTDHIVTFVRWQHDR